MISNFANTISNTQNSNMSRTNSSSDQSTIDVGVEMIDIELTRQFSESEARKDNLAMTHISSAINNDCSALSGKGHEGFNMPIKAIGSNKRNSNLDLHSHHNLHKQGIHEANNHSAHCAERDTACSSSNKVSCQSDESLIV